MQQEDASLHQLVENGMAKSVLPPLTAPPATLWSTKWRGYPCATASSTRQPKIESYLPVARTIPCVMFLQQAQ